VRNLAGTQRPIGALDRHHAVLRPARWRSHASMSVSV